MAKKFENNVRRKILDKIVKMKLLFQLTMCGLRFKRMMRKYRPTVLLRNRQNLKQSLNFTAVLEQSLFKKQAGDIVYHYLDRTWLSDNFRLH